MDADTDNTIFKCTYFNCPLKFNSRTHLSKHLNLHKSINGYRCLQCTECFKSQSEIDHHTTMCTGTVSKSRRKIVCPFECNGCGLKFTTSNNLLQHHRLYCMSRKSEKHSVLTMDLLKFKNGRPYKNKTYANPRLVNSSCSDLKCRDCGLIFNNQDLFLSHVTQYCKKQKPNTSVIVIESYSIPVIEKETEVEVVDEQETEDDWVEMIELNEEEVDSFAINTAVSVKDELFDQEEMFESKNDSDKSNIKTEIKEEPPDADFDGATAGPFVQIKSECSDVDTENFDYFKIKEEPVDSLQRTTIIPSSDFFQIKNECPEAEFDRYDV